MKFVAKNFKGRVLELLEKIPRGKVTTYKEIAGALKNPNASRAVGNACNRNPNSPKVPCHRVVGFDGSIGGYASGVRAKIKLLEQEGVEVKSGKIVDFEEKLFSFN